MMTIGSLCDHCSLLKMQQFCSSAYIEQFRNPVLSSMGAIMNPFDLLLGGLAHGLHFCECLSIIVPHQFPSSLHICSTYTIWHIKGQLILKRLFVSSIFSKKKNKNKSTLCFTVVKQNWLVRFFGGNVGLKKPFGLFLTFREHEFYSFWMGVSFFSWAKE